MKKLPFASAIRSNRRGVTLLMALLVLATVTGIGVAVSSLIVSDVLQSKNIDNAVTAYYAAEAGMERSLFAVKGERQNSVGSIDNAVVLVDAPHPLLGNGASITTDGTVGQDILISNLQEDDSIQVDLFDPEGSCPGNVCSNVGSVQFNWRDNNRTTWIETVTEAFKFSGTLLVPPDLLDPATRVLSNSFFRACDADNSGPACTSDCLCDTWIDDQYSASRYYRVQVKALYGDIHDLQISAYRGDGATGGVEPLKNRIQISSTGSFGRTQAKISTSIPWRTPASGVFNFVLFGEETITK